MTAPRSIGSIVEDVRTGRAHLGDSRWVALCSPRINTFPTVRSDVTPEAVAEIAAGGEYVCKGCQARATREVSR